MSHETRKDDEPREPLFGRRTLAAALSLYVIWVGLIFLSAQTRGWLGFLATGLALLWTLTVVCWVGYVLLVYWIGKPRVARFARWVSWVRIPPFIPSYVINLATLVCFTTWIVIDAWFPFVWHMVRTGVSGDNNEWEWLAENLPWRVAVFLAVAGAGIVSFGAVVARMFVGNKDGGRNLRAWMLVTALIAGWLALLSSYDQLQWWGIRRRARSLLPRFQAAAVPLSQQWPTIERGVLPEAGEFLAYPVRLPNLLILREDHGFPLSDGFGARVSRTDGGGFRFDLGAAVECTIEYHPSGSRPEAHTGPFRLIRSEIRDIVPLSEGWYLVRYRESLVNQTQ